MREKTYTYDELNHILNALDFYSRVLCGQYEERVKIYRYQYLFYDLRCSYLIKNLKKLRDICIPHLARSGFYISLGICNIDTPFIVKRAYDIYQVLRYQKAYHDYPEGGNTVNFNSPFIHGEWNIRKVTITTLNKLIEPYYYPDYYPRGMQRGGECPLVIKEFNDDKQTLKVLRDVIKIDFIIQIALNFYELIAQRNLTEAFMILYPEKDDEEFMGVLEETEKELN